MSRGSYQSITHAGDRSLPPALPTLLLRSTGALYGYQVPTLVSSICPAQRWIMVQPAQYLFILPVLFYCRTYVVVGYGNCTCTVPVGTSTAREAYQSVTQARFLLRRLTVLPVRAGKNRGRKDGSFLLVFVSKRTSSMLRPYRTVRHHVPQPN
jgi:hypothetical protein